MKKYPISIVLLLVLGVLAASPVRAQEGISATPTVSIDFPNSITFSIKAQSTSDITGIALNYKVEKITTVSVITEIEPVFSPAPQVETSWTWDMRKGSLPPGATISYFWHVEDAAGHKIDTGWASVSFEDTRYQWQSIAAGKVTLFWYQGDSSFAQALLDAATAGLDRLARDTGAQLERPVKLYIYAGAGDLRGSLIFPQEWTGGVAFTEYGIVAIGVSTQNLAWGKTTVVHELAHLVTYQMTFNPYGALPTWLEEGLATYNQGSLDAEFRSAFDQAAAQDKLISVQSLSGGFPADPNAAVLAYAQSYKLVEFLIQHFGRENMLQLLGVFKRGETYDNALNKVYGFDIEGLDREWRANIGLPPTKEATPSPQPAVASTATATATSAAEPPAKAASGCGASPEGGPDVALLGVLGILLMAPAARAVRVRSRRKDD